MSIHGAPSLSDYWKEPAPGECCPRHPVIDIMPEPRFRHIDGFINCTMPTQALNSMFKKLANPLNVVVNNAFQLSALRRRKANNPRYRFLCNLVHGLFDRARRVYRVRRGPRNLLLKADRLFRLPRLQALNLRSQRLSRSTIHRLKSQTTRSSTLHRLRPQTTGRPTSHQLKLQRLRNSMLRRLKAQRLRSSTLRRLRRLMPQRLPRLGLKICIRFTV